MSLMETRKEAVEPWESEAREKDPQVEKIREQGRRDGGSQKIQSGVRQSGSRLRICHCLASQPPVVTPSLRILISSPIKPGKCLRNPLGGFSKQEPVISTV